MSLTPLIVTIILAFGSAFALASRLSQVRPASGSKENASSPLADFIAGCRALSETACAPFEPQIADRVGALASAASPCDSVPPLPATGLLDQPALLPLRLRLLDVEPGEFVRLEPTVFRQLAIRCARCADADRCGRDLSDETTAQNDESWIEYCPNASTLNAIGMWGGVGMSYAAWKSRTTASSALLN
jgi:hypothetical protein